MTVGPSARTSPRRVGSIPRTGVAIGRGEDGFALIGVLWLVVLVAVVGLDFALQARGITRRVANTADHSVAAAAAESGLAHAVEALQRRLGEGAEIPLGDGRLLDPWLEPGRFLGDTIEVADARVVVRLRDVGTMVNLNRASEGELRSLFAALRVDDGEADRVAQAVLDWRDPDRLRRERGGDREEYLQADAPRLPADGPFGRVDELLHVRGVTPELFERVAPFLTVHGSGRVNAATAPVEVLSALPGMSDELLAEIVRRRRSGEPVTDLFSMTAGLDEGARARVRQALPFLVSRLSAGTEEVLAVAEASVGSRSAVAVATGVVVRVADDALLTDVRIR